MIIVSNILIVSLTYNGNINKIYKHLVRFSLNILNSILGKLIKLKFLRFDQETGDRNSYITFMMKYI